MANARLKRGNARVQRTVDTALDLFDRHGFHAVGIDKILSAAGLAKMTVYHHSKALIVGVLEKREPAAFREKFATAALEGLPARGARAARDVRRNRGVDATAIPPFRGLAVRQGGRQSIPKDHAVKRAVLAHKAWLFGRCGAPPPPRRRRSGESSPPSYSC